jgi:hypothetical protein
MEDLKGRRDLQEIPRIWDAFVLAAGLLNKNPIEFIDDVEDSDFCAEFYQVMHEYWVFNGGIIGGDALSSRLDKQLAESPKTVAVVARNYFQGLATQEYKLWNIVDRNVTDQTLTLDIQDYLDPESAVFQQVHAADQLTELPTGEACVVAKVINLDDTTLTFNGTPLYIPRSLAPKLTQFEILDEVGMRKNMLELGTMTASQMDQEIMNQQSDRRFTCLLALWLDHVQQEISRKKLAH